METRISTSIPSDQSDLAPRDDSRPLLLVSVRDEVEFRAVRKTDVDVIDFKEPSEGPLAPCRSEIWQSIASERRNSERRNSERQNSERQNGESAPVARLSAALGEYDQAMVSAQHLPPEFDFAKAGPSGCASPERLLRLWEQTRARIDERTELVGVAYADWRRADCLPPEAIIESASQFGISRLLIDTFIKDGRSSIDHLGVDRLRDLREGCRSRGIWWALAGSIRLPDLRLLEAANALPDCIGVRGNICDGPREGKISPSRVEAWVETLSAVGTT